MPEERFSRLFYQTCLIGAFLGLSATLYFLCGLAGYIESPLPNGALAAAVVFAVLYFLRVFLFSARDENRLELLLWLLILLTLATEIVLGLVPPIARDELTHHLAVPKLYAAAGRIFEISFDYPSYYPMLVEMLFTPWVKWQWDFVPKLIHGLFGFLTGLLLYAYLARRLSPTYGLLGFFFFVTTPAILRLANWGYVDLGLVFYSTAALLCLLRCGEDKNSRRWLLLAGLSAGFAVATKPNGLLALLLLFFMLAWVAAKEEDKGVGKSAFRLGPFLAAACLPLFPWLARNFAWTGNPFFPFFPSLFAGAAGGGGGGSGLSILARRHLLYGESGWQIAALPLRIFFSGQDDNPQYFDGVLNPILILFLPWAFKGKWVEEKKIIFAFAQLYFLFAFFLVELRIRYILPIVPPLVILLVYGIHNVYLRIARPSVLFAALIFLSALNGAYLWNYFHLVSPMGYLLGEESRGAYLTRMLPDYPALRFINQNLPSTARIYLIFMGRRVYYCDRPYFHDGGDNPWLLRSMIQSAHSDEDIKANLLEKGLSHLLVREELLKRFLDYNLTSQQQEVWNSFSTHYLRALYQDRDYSLYQIHG